MKTSKIIPAVLMLGTVLLTAPFLRAENARFATLVVGPDQATTNEITIAAHETAQLVSYPRFRGIGIDSTWLTIKKGNASWVITEAFMYLNGTTFDPIIIAGPATFSLRQQTPAISGICTLKITPESFPPDKTVIIPEGTSALVFLECSTNLITWTNIWSGAYSNVPTHKFFRLAAQRTQ